MKRALHGGSRPTVGLLNIGVEEVKGLEAIKDAGQLLREADLPFLDYVGFVEGDDIGRGGVDVVVTEGFAGNIALKTAEGTVRQITAYLREATDNNPLSKIGFLLARGAFGQLRQKLDTRRRERWRISRPQRPGDQISRRDGRGRFRCGDRNRLQHGEGGTRAQDQQ